MATTLMPVDPAMSPQRITRLLTISANLLPDEIIAARQARRTRAWVLIVVFLVACLCAAWVVLANREKQAADRELTVATTEVFGLQRDQRQFASVVKVRNDTDLLKKQLGTVMANDLDWAALLTLLRTTGEPSDVIVAGITGSLAQAGDSGKSGTLPSTSKSSSIGSVVVTGTAPDKEAVAAYVDRLAKHSTIANPYVTSVTSTAETGDVSFSLNVDITQAALCGRFGEPCPGTGGK
ncbi:hypothetical protein [Actinoplanes auranticolor]|nr:hypothetical protein [Actinoplanes auranticolor]